MKKALITGITEQDGSYLMELLLEKGYVVRRPIILIYFEACLDQADAVHREKYLKTYYGKLFLGNRLKSYLTG